MVYDMVRSTCTVGGEVESKNSIFSRDNSLRLTIIVYGQGDGLGSTHQFGDMF